MGPIEVPSFPSGAVFFETFCNNGTEDCPQIGSRDVGTRARVGEQK